MLIVMLTRTESNADLDETHIYGDWRNMLTRCVGLPASYIHLYWVVNNQVCWTDGVDLCWISPQSLHSISHCGKVHYRWYSTAVQSSEWLAFLGWHYKGNFNAITCMFALLYNEITAVFKYAREILQNDPGRFERDLHTLILLLLPGQDVFHILL